MDVFGRRKITISSNKSNGAIHTSLPPIPSVNDLLIIGRDEISSMNNLKDSLKCIKKLNNASRFQHHRTKQTQSIISKDIEMFFDSETSYNDDYTENYEDNIYDRQADQNRIEEEENGAEDSDIENNSFEEEEDSDPGFSDFIALSNSDFNLEENVEQNVTEVNLCESRHNNDINDHQISSSSTSSQFDNSISPFDLLQQASLEDESNIHQIDDALSFVSSIFCSTMPTSSSTSNSSLISPSISINLSRSNSSLETPRTQNSQNNSARSARSILNQQVTTNLDISENINSPRSNYSISNSSSSSARLDRNPQFRAMISRPNQRTPRSNQSNLSYMTNLLNFTFNVDS